MENYFGHYVHGKNDFTEYRTEKSKILLDTDLKNNSVGL